MNFTNFPLFSLDVLNSHVYKMKTLGYSVVNDFFSEETCFYLREHLEKAIDDYRPVNESKRSYLDRYHMHDLLCKDIVFAKTLEDQRLQQLVAPLLGEYWIMYAYTSSSLPPHGDNYGSRIHVDCPRFIPN